jgi:hypothetical protein
LGMWVTGGALGAKLCASPNPKTAIRRQAKPTPLYPERNTWSITIVEPPDMVRRRKPRRFMTDPPPRRNLRVRPLSSLHRFVMRSLVSRRQVR